MKLINLDKALNMHVGEWGNLYKDHVNKGLFNIFNLLGTSNIDVSKAEGAKVELRDGRVLLDFSSGMGVLNLGHNHPRILAAEKKCHEKKEIDILKIAPQKLQGILAFNLSQMLPSPLSVSFFAVSGAEAVEGALKLCEKYQGNTKKKFITCQGSYHGKTHGAL